MKTLVLLALLFPTISFAACDVPKLTEFCKQKFTSQDKLTNEQFSNLNQCAKEGASLSYIFDPNEEITAEKLNQFCEKLK